MPKTLKPFRLSDASIEKLLALTERYGTQTTVVEVALDRLYEQEIAMSKNVRLFTCVPGEFVSDALPRVAAELGIPVKSLAVRYGKLPAGAKVVAQIRVRPGDSPFDVYRH